MFVCVINGGRGSQGRPSFAHNGAVPKPFHFGLVHDENILTFGPFDTDLHVGELACFGVKAGQVTA